MDVTFLLAASVKSSTISYNSAFTDELASNGEIFDKLSAPEKSVIVC